MEGNIVVGNIIFGLPLTLWNAIGGGWPDCPLAVDGDEAIR
mgnify:CR=1 FL=1